MNFIKKNYKSLSLGSIAIVAVILVCIGLVKAKTEVVPNTERNEKSKYISNEKKEKIPPSDFVENKKITDDVANKKKITNNINNKEKTTDNIVSNDKITEHNNNVDNNHAGISSNSKKNNIKIKQDIADKKQSVTKTEYNNTIISNNNLIESNPPVGEVQYEKEVLNHNDREIDNGIYGLKYDPRKILAFNGEAIENFKPAEGFENPDKYIVVKREKKSISDSTADIAVIDSMNDRTYPGAIQLANRNLVENKPDIISCERKPITVSVDLPGMDKDGKKIVEAPTYSSVKSAINSLLTTWNKKYSAEYAIPTRVSYSDAMVYSKAQLSTMFGCNFKALNKSLNIDFNSIYKGEKKVMLLAYKQIFYTVSVDAPNRPSDLFNDNVTFDELSLKGVNKDNPPAYVSSVSYGRTIYVKLETTSKSLNVKAAFKALIENQDVKGNAEYKSILNQSSFTATVLGGNAKEHNKVITKNFDEIRDVIKNNAEYGPKNPGYPIAYTTTFLKNNQVATINSKTDYVETTATEYNNGKIVLDHNGGYVVQYEVTWDEVNYDKHGKELITHRRWDGNYRDITAHFNTEIYLRGNSRNINIRVRECTGLAWEWWRNIIDEKNMPLVKKRTVYTWGTTLFPGHSVVVK